MTTPQSRIQVLDTPVLAPGVCLVCGTSGIDDRKFVDFGKQLEWYGAVYLCSECLKEVAIAVGYIPVADFDKLYADYRDLEVSRDLSEAKYSGVVSALDQLFNNYRNSGLSTDDVLGPSKAIEAESGSTVGSVEEAIVGESETNESDIVEGPDDLFDASDFDDD